VSNPAEPPAGPRQACTPPAAGRGATVWTVRLEWGLVSGEFTVQQYGSNGQHGRPSELTVKRAGTAHCCVACGHDIPRGALYGVTAGPLRYCGCCVTATRPEDQFRRGAA
jgi:hypothetical protein